MLLPHNYFKMKSGHLLQSKRIAMHLHLYRGQWDIVKYWNANLRFWGIKFIIIEKYKYVNSYLFTNNYTI